MPLRVRRWVSAGVAVLAGLALLVALGPARLRPWECRDTKSASTARGAVDAFYSSCWSRPKVEDRPIGQAPGADRQWGEGYGGWNELAEYRVHYGASKLRFLLIGQRERGGSWRVIQGEGTGP